MKKFVYCSLAFLTAFVACSDDSSSNVSDFGESSSSFEVAPPDVLPTSSSDLSPVSSAMSLVVPAAPDTVVFDAQGVMGRFKDSRDGHEYKAVKIGNQVWMAENLMYGHNSVKSARYSWSEAMDSLHTGCGAAITTRGNLWDECPIPAPVQGICPNGWHLPNTADFKTLIDFVGGEAVAGDMLKSTTGWDDGGNGKDAYGFNGYPQDYGQHLYLWGSDIVEKNEALVMLIWDDKKGAYLSSYFKGWGGNAVPAVRCVLGQGNGIDAVPEKTNLGTYSGTFGSFTDSRDGAVYKTVEIGTQTWMAENLKYKHPAKVEDSYYYDGAMNAEVSGCKQDELNIDLDYGMWSPCPIPAPMQGICPDGWHLPSRTEWSQLLAFVDGMGETRGLKKSSSAGRLLKSTKQDAGASVGVDAFGFSATVWDDDIETCFWAGSVSGYADWFSNDFFCIYKDSAFVSFSMVESVEPAAVRCIKGEGYRTIDSSPVESSSSVVGASSASTYKGEYGTLKDARDGNVYKTVEIAGKVWMAENLKYETPDGKSACNCGDTSSCEVYGRLYSLNTAIGMSGDCIYENSCGKTGTIQGICPDGWHLPSAAEMQKMLYETDGYDSPDLLKSTTGWSRYPGVDAFGFGAKPAGIAYLGSDGVGLCSLLSDEQEVAQFWAVDYDNVKAFTIFESEPKGFGNGFKDEALSIRCVKD